MKKIINALWCGLFKGYFGYYIPYYIDTLVTYTKLRFFNTLRRKNILKYICFFNYSLYFCIMIQLYANRELVSSER